MDKQKKDAYWLKSAILTVLQSMAGVLQGKHKLTFFVVLITGTSNAVLNYMFIKNDGMMGAACATFTSNVGIAQYILNRELNISLSNTLRFSIGFYPEFYHKYFKKTAR